MALNREDKRRLQKQGEVGPDGEPLDTKGDLASPSKEKRTSVKQFLKEVRAELRKVAWPTRSETINYSIVVLVSLVFMTLLIFLIDLAFSDLVLRLFNAK